jgi:uncharacterized protein
MDKAIFKDTTSFNKLVLILLCIVVSFAVFYFAGLLAVKLFYHIDLNTLGDNPTPEIFSKYKDAFRILQISQSIGFFIVPAFLAAFLIGGHALGYLSLNKSPLLVSLVIMVMIIFSSVPLINYLVEFNQGIKLPARFDAVEQWLRSTENEAQNLTETFMHVSAWQGILFNLFMIALLPAFGEELIFRGLFQRLFTEWTKNVHAGIWIAAFLFSFIHLQFYGFIPRLILGVMLGYAYYLSKNLWLSITAHFVNNAMAVLFYFYYLNGKVTDSLETIGTTRDSLYAALLSFVSVGFLYYLLVLIENKSRLSKPV